MYKIAVEREFDMAHIVETDTKCGRIHGHRWRLVVEIESDKLQDDGMIVDFAELKSIIDDSIISLLDHKLLVPNRFIKAYNKIVSFSINGKDYMIPNEDLLTFHILNSTSECLIKFIYDILRPKIVGKKFKILKLRLYETPTSYAEYIPEGEK